MDLAAELEDGELGDYSPLPRPELATVRTVPRIQDSSSDDDDDNDSDGPKRPRLKCLPKPTAVPAKFNVWAENLQEEALTEKLVSCDVVTHDRSRDVESYFIPREERSSASKRQHDGVSVRDRLGPRPPPESSSSDEDRERIDARHLLALRVTAESEPEDVARDIANKLFEEKDDLVAKVVKVLGIEKAIKLFERTKDIEADGGMMILNGARRRTPGGVFFYMTRTASNATREQLTAMFEDEHRATVEKRRKERAKKRKEQHAKLRQLAQETAHLPVLPTRVETIMAQAENKAGKEDSDEDEGEIIDDEAEEPPTPPPRPQMETAPLLSSREITSYDDDFLQVDNDMDLF